MVIEVRMPSRQAAKVACPFCGKLSDVRGYSNHVGRYSRMANRPEKKTGAGRDEAGVRHLLSSSNGNEAHAEATPGSAP